jgi:hypothetical protein
MKIIRNCFLSGLMLSGTLIGQGRAEVGAGNEKALRTGSASPLVRTAMRDILENVRRIGDLKLRNLTLDAVGNPRTCVTHRVGVTEEVKTTLLGKLAEQGLLNLEETARGGVFPPLKNEAGACPQLPLRFDAAPGSSFGSHHSFPGGLALHEDFNLQNAKHLAALYQKQYGPGLLINRDFVIAAPVWHDWAKTMVFQWYADGTEFGELNVGGTGRTDNYGAAGDSRTGAHHILGLAEAMARGLEPELVIMQASAHAAPTLGNEYKVVNWLRAAAILARIDPVAKGYLAMDRNGNSRLPPVRHLADGIDLNQAGQTNILLEYQIHNLSDADFVESMPAVSTAEVVLRSVARKLGYDTPDQTAYNNKFRNIVLAYLGPERIMSLYSDQGLDAVVKEVKKLRMPPLT